MSINLLRAAWLAVALGLLSWSFNAMSESLGWYVSAVSLFEFDFPAERPPEASATTFFLGWFFLNLALGALTVELTAREQSEPARRLRPATHAPFAIFLGAMVLILYSGGHFLREILKSEVFCDGNGPEAVVDSLLEHFWPPPHSGRCWLADASEGTQYFLPAESGALTLLFIGVVWFWCATLARPTRRLIAEATARAG